MKHVRYYVQWVAGDNWHDAPTQYTSELSYLDEQEARDLAEKYKSNGFRKVQLVEFMADFEVPAEHIPLAWVR